MRHGPLRWLSAAFIASRPRQVRPADGVPAKAVAALIRSNDR
ncbi:hypothetical protein LC55x_1157 [Lysobacter capsici]|nr:hypothetical protein LC55x_1157 [Lysobacter capsici]